MDTRSTHIPHFQGIQKLLTQKIEHDFAHDLAHVGVASTVCRTEESIVSSSGHGQPHIPHSQLIKNYLRVADGHEYGGGYSYYIGKETGGAPDEFKKDHFAVTRLLDGELVRG